MNDTSDQIKKKFHERLMAKSGGERLKMGASMFDAVKLIARSSMTKNNSSVYLFLRFYGNDFDPVSRERIVKYFTTYFCHPCLSSPPPI